MRKILEHVRAGKTQPFFCLQWYAYVSTYTKYSFRFQLAMPARSRKRYIGVQHPSHLLLSRSKVPSQRVPAVIPIPRLVLPA